MPSFLHQGSAFYRQITRLALPILLQNVVTSTLAMADTFMVGMLGEESIAALTLANIPLFVLQLFLFGMQSGSSVIISQNWGRQNLDAIQRTIGVGMSLSALVTGLFALILFFWPAQFLSLFGNDPQVIALAASYGRWIGFAYFFNGLSLMYLGAYRSIGRPEIGLYMLGLSSVVNIFLNWVFIYGNLGAPALGVSGAAIGTLVARSLEVLIMIGHTLHTKGFRVKLPLLLRPGQEAYRQFLRHSSSVVLNETAWGLGTAAFPAMMGHMKNSTEILAALAITNNIERLTTVAGFGLAGATSIVIGNAIGAGESKEQVRSMGQCLSFCGFFTGLATGLLLFLCSRTLLPWVLAPLFLLSPQATQFAQIMMTGISLYTCFRICNAVTVVGNLRGGGDLRYAALVDVLPIWCLSIPLGLLFSMVLDLSVAWVYLAMSTESTLKFYFAIRRVNTTVWVHDLSSPKKTKENAPQKLAQPEGENQEESP